MNTQLNKTKLAFLLALVILAGAVVLPPAANAQGPLADASHHRQQTKNQWRNVGIGAGAVGVYGLLKGDKALAIGGLAGSAYSFSRYEHDRRSQSKIDRARANYYGQSHIYRNGHRYTRHTVYRNGHKYYQFTRG